MCCVPGQHQPLGLAAHGSGLLTSSPPPAASEAWVLLEKQLGEPIAPCCGQGQVCLILDGVSPQGEGSPRQEEVLLGPDEFNCWGLMGPTFGV